MLHLIQQPISSVLSQMSGLLALPGPTISCDFTFNLSTSWVYWVVSSIHLNSKSRGTWDFLSALPKSTQWSYSLYLDKRSLATWPSTSELPVPTEWSLLSTWTDNVLRLNLKPQHLSCLLSGLLPSLEQTASCDLNFHLSTSWVYRVVSFLNLGKQSLETWPSTSELPLHNEWSPSSNWANDILRLDLPSQYILSLLSCLFALSGQTLTWMHLALYSQQILKILRCLFTLPGQTISCNLTFNVSASLVY